MELDVAAAAAGAEGALDGQDALAGLVLDAELGLEDAPLLFDAADHRTGRRRHLQRLPIEE